MRFESYSDAPHWRRATLRFCALWLLFCYTYIVAIINLILKQASAAEQFYRANNYLPAETLGGTILHQRRSLRRLQELQDLG